MAEGVHPAEVKDSGEGKAGGFYIPSLDGLRAISIAIVLLAHAGLGHIIPGGFGVTVFFFLSGYLITTLLRKEEVETGHISLTKFYIRRAFRILPPMYTSLFIACVIAALGWLPGQVHFYPTLIQVLHLTNYYPYLGGEDPMVPGTGILWSLAVEEHFYLLFPMLCFIGLKKMSNGGRAIALALACVAVLAWRCYLVMVLDVAEDRTYFCTDTRIDSILFGCILGLFCNPVLDKPLAIGRIPGLAILAISGAVLLGSLVVRDHVFRETLRYSIQGVALFPIFYFAVVWHKEWYFRWLNLRPIRHVGVLSYSLYLVHFFCLIAVKHVFPELHGVVSAVIGLTISFLLADTIYRVIEKPSAKMRKKFHA